MTSDDEVNGRLVPGARTSLTARVTTASPLTKAGVVRCSPLRWCQFALGHSRDEPPEVDDRRGFVVPVAWDSVRPVRLRGLPF